ncbi:MAG: hypothetical protein E6I48_06310 [Chloroflexi bacterium]|nr:MAG: hypothetical protein E6I48_06310 [Chloroflexota bacterium]
MTPRQRGRSDGDRDVRRDARGLHREAEQLTIEDGAEQPEDIEIGRRVVAEVIRRIEAAGPDLDQVLGPRLERADVAGETGRAQRQQAQRDTEGDEARRSEVRAAVVAHGQLRLGHCQ